ncbi:hypothetical protein [Sphingomonas sp. S2-65]|uniref:hypothetical protein n=1 Tax=Sphingomonas sp. S2-65 TaxID=2903960 RepID=UPI001F3486CC|nr:hypothetical protein [Sphingomonas sp. S2-65]UYY57373.1 hypothetical protein LZ586_11860 [Sphingomonas sp. S2-65]
MSVPAAQGPATPDPYTGALFQPLYAPMSRGDWALELVPMLVAPGYWSPARLVQDVAVLKRRSSTGQWSTWMSMTPMEMESQEIGIRLAHGHVLIFGMGMGWSAAATAMLPAVTQVTVVERDADVIALHQALGTLAQLPDQAHAKLRVVQGDALRYVPEAAVDLLMPDIWLPLVGGDRVGEVARMQANVRARSIYFWGQEMEIARHAVRDGRALDEAGIARTVAGFGLPLLGPQTPDYAERTRHVADRWMRDRWLS